MNQLFFLLAGLISYSTTGFACTLTAGSALVATAVFVIFNCVFYYRNYLFHTNIITYFQIIYNYLALKIKLNLSFS